MNCSHCGIALADSFSVCPACGAPQNTSLTPSPRTPKTASAPRKRPSKKPSPDKTENAGTEKEAKKEAEKKEAEREEAQKRKKEEASLPRKLRHWTITWLIVFALGFAAEKVVDFAFQDGPEKLAAENQLVSNALAGMHPSRVAVNFYTRLAEPHGWKPYQWDAPFNAAEAKRKLVAKYQRQAGAEGDPFPYVPLSQASPLEQTEFLTVSGEMLRRHARRAPLLTPNSSSDPALVFRKRIDTHILDKESLGSPKKIETPLQKALDEMPLVLPSVVSPPPTPVPNLEQVARMQARQAAYNAELNKISGSVLPVDLQFGRGGVMSMFVGGALGLLDAYMFALRVFLPHTPPIVLIALVSVGMALLTIAYSGLNKEPDGRVLFLLLLLLPFGVSVIGWLLWELGEGMTLVCKSVLTAPMLNAVSTSAATPVVAWFSGKAAEHSLVERALEHDFVRRLMGAAGKVD